MAHRQPPEEARALALALLGLPPEASRREIVGAYRSLARATHPDRCADADANDRFAAVVDAYHQAMQDGASAPRPSAAPPAAPRPSPAGTFRPSPRGAPLRAGPVQFTPHQPHPPTGGPDHGADAKR